MAKKKRHQSKYSKPQTTASALLNSTNASVRTDQPHQDTRSVNDLLADLRRHDVNGAREGLQRGQQLGLGVQPSLPPAIRHILHLPEMPGPGPPPGRAWRVDAAGRRLPPGPAPPQSWVSTRASDRGGRGGRAAEQILPDRPFVMTDSWIPDRGSLVDMALRSLARDWDFQREYCYYHLYYLPTHLRTALVAYLGTFNSSSVSRADLEALVLPPAPDTDPDTGTENEICGGREREMTEDDPSIANEHFRRLHLGGSLGRSLRLRELSDLLFPTTSPRALPCPAGVQDSWDGLPSNAPDRNAPDRAPSDNVLPSSCDAAPLTSSIPQALRPLPNLSHLSLAIDPKFAAAVSWRQLLVLATHLPTLTHLSLAFWPEPSLTPNAKYASVVTSQGRSVQYGGTGPYSHSLDGDWFEALLVLRRLSQSLYRLEYLDLTGCMEWSPALWSSAGHDAVDWVGYWGKVGTVRLHPGFDAPAADTDALGLAKYTDLVAQASRLEKHIRGRRAGQGRFITVETAEFGAWKPSHNP